MQDANGKRSYAVAVTLGETAQGSVYTMTPDAAWLAKAAYPVTVDPTVNAYVAGEIWNGTGTNRYPTDERVMRDSCGYGDSVYPDGLPEVLIGPDPLYPGYLCEAVMVFGANLDGIGIPPNATINSAVFHLTVDCDGSEGGDTITVADLPFVPSAATSWTSIEAAYALDAQHPSATATAYTNGYPDTDFNITSIVQYWVTKQTAPLGIRLRADSSSNPIYAHAHDYNALEITYTSTGTVYGSTPGITAGIFMDNTSVAPGSTIEAWLTDGVDGYGWARDWRYQYVNGQRQTVPVDDSISHVVWSVPIVGGQPIGTLTLAGESGGTTALDVCGDNCLDGNHHIGDKFRVAWHVPSNAPLGKYGPTAKIYDTGLGSPLTQNSVDPTPFTISKTVDVGVVTYDSHPPIMAAIGAPNYVAPTSYATMNPGGSVYLRALNGTQNNTAYDNDTKYLARDAAGTDKVAVGAVSDVIDSVVWHVTDSQGRPVGTLTQLNATTSQWIAPATPADCFVTMTIDDKAVNGPDRDDKPQTIMARIHVGTITPMELHLIPDDNDDEDSAIQIARNFCRAVGADETGPAEAHFPALVDYGGAQPTYYAPRWSVKFESGTEVQVVDSTSPVIARYTNFKTTRDLLESQAPPTATLGNSDATNAAGAVRMASGSSDTIGASTITHGQMTDSLAAGQICTVVYGRSFNDPYNGSVPYRDQAVRVMLQDKDAALLDPGETTALLGYSLTLPSAEPAPATRLYTCSTPPLPTDDCTLASNFAIGILESQAPDFVPVSASTPSLMVVQPNTYWINGNSEPSGAAPMIAWVCVYTDANYLSYEVWVRADTVTVVGGCQRATAKSGGRRSASSNLVSLSRTAPEKPKIKATTAKRVKPRKHGAEATKRRAHR
jgi:hypothetical protein